LEGDEEEEGSLHNFTRILLAMKEKEEKETTIQQESNLSELIAPWLMSEFLHRASGLFIAPNGRRDNYKRELKKGK
jgi:hypothetical protein